MHAPRHWRERAEQMIALADGATDPVVWETMLSVAAGYEQLAQRAEERLKKRPGSQNGITLRKK
jgi:hypothetical protein